MPEPTITIIEEQSTAELLAEIEADEAKERAASKATAEEAKIARFKLKKRLEAELKGAEGRAFGIVETLGGLVVLRKPAGVVWKAFTKSEREDSDVEALVRASLVEPTWERMARILDEYPGTIDELVKPITQMLGVVLGDRTKK